MSAGYLPSDEDGVRILTLTRAPGNALSIAALKGLKSEVERAGRDSAVRAVVLASGLPRYFSSGLDLEEIMALPPERRPEAFEALLSAYRALLELPKPAVAAVNGAAILGGWILAMGCDWRVMAESSGKVALSEVKLGLSPTPALVTRLSALCSDPRVVKEMVLRGRTLRAAEAFQAALVDELVPEEEVLSRSVFLARRLAKAAPAAFASLKKGMNAPFLDAGLWTRAMAEFDALIGGSEAREGMEAMRAKRRPRWED